MEDYLGDWQTLGVAYVSMSQHFESADIPGQHSDVSPGHGQTRPPLMASKLLISLVNDGTAHQYHEAFSFDPTWIISNMFILRLTVLL